MIFLWNIRPLEDLGKTFLANFCWCIFCSQKYKANPHNIISTYNDYQFCVESRISIARITTVLILGISRYKSITIVQQVTDIQLDTLELHVPRADPSVVRPPSERVVQYSQIDSIGERGIFIRIMERFYLV